MACPKLASKSNAMTTQQSSAASIAGPRVKQPQPVLKWTVLVTLSAVCSFVAALLTEHTHARDIAAMLLGIATFIFAYIRFERWAVARQYEQFVSSLKTAVIVKIILQLIPGLELGAGFIANFLAESVDLPKGFIRTYLMTDIVGLELSIIVVLLTLLIIYIRSLVRARAAKKEAAGKKAELPI
jgi:hypothetical protein